MESSNKYTENYRSRLRSANHLWLKYYTPVFKTSVWKYTCTTDEKPYPFYAPHPRNPEDLPIYIKVEADDEDHRKLFKTSLPTTGAYISLFALIALGRKDKDKMMGKAESQLGIQNQLKDDMKWQQCEAKFLENTDNNWQVNFAAPHDTPPEIPIRDESGKLSSVQLSTDWQGWLDVLPDLYHLNKQAKYRGKPVRHLNIAFENPILVKPMDFHDKMIARRFNAPLKKVLKDLIDEINAEKDPDLPGEKSYKWRLDIFDDENMDHSNNYITIAKDPFYLYETLISQKDWTKYMSELEFKKSPIRDFPRVDQVYKSCDKIMGFVGARDIVLQSYVYDSKGDYEKLGLGQKDRPDTKEMETLKESFSRIVLPEVINIKKEARARALKRLRKRREGLESLNWAYSWHRGSSSLINELSVLKINNAVGKRLDEANQKAVMGNVSATEVRMAPRHTYLTETLTTQTQIGRAMGWSSDRLRSGVYPAEWLHLSAFSWGGVANEAEEDGFVTSQNFENLVFGTSETNSVMTRYEMAWQRLFITESELPRPGNEQNVMGTLSINCNDFSRGILFDFRDGGNYKTGILEFNEKELKLLEDGGFKSEEYYQKQKSSGQKRSGSATNEEMLTLANDFPFIVYSIDYGLTANFVSRLFQVEGMECWFSFYPFRRQFYHRAEAMLDDKIFEKLKREASGLKEKNQPFSIIKGKAPGRESLI